MSDQSAVDGAHRYVKVRSEPATSSSELLRQEVPPDPAWIFDELPKASIVSVSRPDASDITPMLLSYTIEFKYKQVRCPRTHSPNIFVAVVTISTSLALSSV
ncbi:Phospholipase D p1 [Platanthera guangdongensis]|uniref:Phospholipase D p1 n=1 Tax=Platanthera guangdongensis TaxID=2320717 RepID=A0ABR2MAN0_9ASPA